jgi:transposase
MKKHIYRSTNIKDLKVEELSELVKDQRIALGVDVAKEDFVGTLMDERRIVHSILKWKNPIETRQFVDLMVQLPCSSLEVVMEPSSTYGEPLRNLFMKAGIQVFLLSPKRSHDAAEVYDGVPSLHDAKSATLLARLHLEGLSSPWRIISEGERELSSAIKSMELYDDQYYRNVNRLESQLGLYWPELPYYLELTSVTLLELVGSYGTAEAMCRDLEGARKLMKEVGGHLLSSEKIEGILLSAQKSIGVSCIECERAFLMELARETRRLQKAAKKSRKKVEELSDCNQSTKNMGSVVGKATAAVLVNELGEPENYDNAGSYVKTMGLNLKEKSSGKHQGQLKITKRGSSTVRRYMYLASLRLIQKDEVVRAWYSKKAERDGGKKMKAVVAVMRKLASALWHVGRGKAFNSRLLFDVKSLNLV